MLSTNVLTKEKISYAMKGVIYPIEIEGVSYLPVHDSVTVSCASDIIGEDRSYIDDLIAEGLISEQALFKEYKAKHDPKYISGFTARCVSNRSWIKPDLIPLWESLKGKVLVDRDTFITLESVFKHHLNEREKHLARMLNECLVFGFTSHHTVAG